MSDEIIIPCASLSFFFIVFGFFALMRYMSYRETLALADRGLVRGDLRRGGNGKDTLRWGIVITAVGLALCIGLYPLGFMVGDRFPLGFGPWLLIGLLPTFFGVGLILIYVLTRDDEKKIAPPNETPVSIDPPPAAE
jgi:hypothetical protein